MGFCRGSQSLLAFALASYACSGSKPYPAAGDAPGAAARSGPAAADDGSARAYSDTTARAAASAHARSAAECALVAPVMVLIPEALSKGSHPGTAWRAISHSQPQESHSTCRMHHSAAPHSALDGRRCKGQITTKFCRECDRSCQKPLLRILLDIQKVQQHFERKISAYRRNSSAVTELFLEPYRSEEGCFISRRPEAWMTGGD